MKRFLAHKYIFLDQAIVSGGNFLAIVFLARILGIENFGVFSVFWLAVLFVGSLVMAGIIFPMNTIYPKLDEHLRENYLSGCIMFFLLCGCILISLGSVGVFLFESLIDVGWMEYIAPFFLYALGVHMQEMVRRIFIVSNNSVLALVSDGITHVSRVAIIVGYNYFYGLEVKDALYIYFASSLLGALPFLTKIIILDSIFENIKVVWKLNRPSAIWLFPSAIMQWTSVNLYFILAAFLLGPMGIAAVRVCQSVLSFLNVPIQALESIVPKQASILYHGGGRDQVKSYILKCALLGIGPIILLFFFVLVFGEAALEMIYGIEYGRYYQVLLVYTLSYYFIFLMVPVRGGLMAIGKSNVWFNAYIFSSFISLLLSYYLVTTYLEVGVAIGIFISYAGLLAAASYGLNKELQIVE